MRYPTWLIVVETTVGLGVLVAGLGVLVAVLAIVVSLGRLAATIGIGVVLAPVVLWLGWMVGHRLTRWVDDPSLSQADTLPQHRGDRT